ncbi:MAG: FAD-binding protein, partial [Patescibacteria group bacterium]
AFVKLNGKIEAILAGKTILATGGFGQLFARTTNPKVSVGDGIAAAHRAGARLKDLEFIQFHPTALVGKQTRLTLLSESLRGEGAVLRNSKGERFLPSYSKAAELAPRDLVARAIFEELKNGKVYLDFTRANEKYLRDRFPLIWRETTRAGFNLARDLIPIFPVAHYACGGVVTNLKGETSVKNLLAIGEVARTGVHGANRLASNSLAEAVVFGRAAGETAKKIKIPATKVCVPKYCFDVKEDRKIIKTIRTEMWERVGIVRTRKGLQAALKALEKLKPKSLPAVNALTVAKLVAKAALARKKSVGTHFVLGNREQVSGNRAREH